MAVSVMRRLSVIVHTSDADKILRALMWMCTAHIEKTEIPSGNVGDADGVGLLSRVQCDTEISQITRQLGLVRDSLDLLASRGSPKKGLFPQKPEVETAVFTDQARWKRCGETAERLAFIGTKIAALKAEEQRENDLCAAYMPWADYDLPLCGVRTLHSVTMPGIFPSATAIGELAATIENTYSAFLSEVSRDGAGIYVSVTAYADEYDSVLKYLNTHGFSRTSFGDEACTAQSGLDTAAENIRMLLIHRASLESELDELLSETDELRLYYDILSTRLAELNAKKKLVQTESVMLLSGWIPAEAEQAVADKLGTFACAFEFTDPDDGDDVPVYLQNNRLASQFEPVVALYSLPKYNTFDPTAIMSVFYILIFGLMFADVGYGLLLTLGCAAAIRLMKPTGTMKKFMTMFSVCGLSCIVMGVLFGGYFGDLPTAIMQNFMGIENPPEIALWFSPVTDPMMFLVVSLAIGAVHLLTALGIKFYILTRRGRLFDAVCDVGSWFILFAGGGLSFIPAISTIGLVLVVVGLLMLVFTQGRAEKNLIMKLLKGIMSLYDIVGYFSDLLSYSRILSLGLASAVIASVVNILGTMGGPGPAGVIGLILAFLIGHTLNLAINVLGTFVHTSRLQYIEFFGKFYEDDGRPFTPLMPEAKYVIFKG